MGIGRFYWRLLMRCTHQEDIGQTATVQADPAYVWIICGRLDWDTMPGECPRPIDGNLVEGMMAGR
jgi:hypothetical protein